MDVANTNVAEDIKQPIADVIDEEKASSSVTERESATPETSEKVEFSPPPDGGLKAWMCIVGGWLVLFCTFGFSTSFGVFQDYYETAGAADSSTISWIGSLQVRSPPMLTTVRHSKVGIALPYVRHWPSVREVV